MSKPINQQNSHPIEAVVFDAVGTIMYPNPSVADAYRAAIRRHCRQDIDPEVVSSTIRVGLKNRSSGSDLATSEDAEKAFWANLIRQLCPSTDGFQDCFDDLFEHFSSGSNWRCFPEVAEVMTSLLDRKITVGVASNFDNRLNQVCDQLPAVAAIPHRIVSSLVGYRKPSKEFFAAVEKATGVPAERTLMVGDDIVNDIEGAQQAGLQAALIDRSGEPPTLSGVHVLSDLRQLIAIVEESQSLSGDDEFVASV